MFAIIGLGPQELIVILAALAVPLAIVLVVLFLRRKGPKGPQGPAPG